MERQVRQNHTELVPAITPDHIGGAQVLLEHLAKLAQHDVAGDMAIGVIDGLEVIDVDQRNRAAPCPVIR